MTVNKCYTVKRLKEELQQYPDDMRVFINTWVADVDDQIWVCVEELAIHEMGFRDINSCRCPENLTFKETKDGSPFLITKVLVIEGAVI